MERVERLKVFISYTTCDGLALGNQAAVLLKENGREPWIYPHSKTLGATTWTEIADCIAHQSDGVLYICTDGSVHSYGQRLEANYALNHRKTIFTIVIDEAEVPVELTANNHTRVQGKDFDREVRALAQNLPRIIAHIKQLEPNLTATDLEK